MPLAEQIPQAVESWKLRLDAAVDSCTRE